MAEILIFLAGFVIVAFGGVQFSKAAVHLATQFKVKRVVIGATIISLATTVPESIVAIISATANHQGLALGNALGSPVANIGLILGLVLLFGRVNFEKNVLRLTAILLVLSVFSFFLSYISQTINFIGGLLLIMASILYLLLLFKIHEEPAEPQHELEAISLVKKFSQILKSFSRLILGLGLIILGGFLIISGAVNLAKILGVSEIFIGLTFVAVGTSLPELTLAIASIFRKTSSVSVGNLIGASILTLTLTLGMAAVIVPVKVATSVIIFDFPAIFLISSIFLLAQIWHFNQRILGASFLIFYLLYLTVLKIVG